MPEFHRQQPSQEAWKQDVLAERIVLEELDTERYDLYAHQNEDIVRLTPEQLKQRMADKEKLLAAGQLTETDWSRHMKLGLSIGYSKAQMDLPVALVQRAEELGYDSVWSAEAYGSDAVTPLAFLAAVTKTDPPGHRDHAVGGPHAGQCGDVRGHHRCAGGRWPVHRRPGRFRAADRRGLVWTAVGTAVLPAEGLRRDHAQDLPRGTSR